MGKYVDKVLSAIERSGQDKGSAIAIAKSRGLIKQSGRHLASGPGRKIGIQRKKGLQ